MKNQNEKAASGDNDLPNNPHDKLAKVLLKDVNNVRALLKAKAPQNLLDILKLETLRLFDGSYVDESLAEQIADVVLLCDTIDGETVIITFIIEHKSYVPSYPPFQFMHYQDRAWARQIEAKDQHPMPSVPIVFYHGKEPWTIKPWKHYLRGWREEFAPYTPPGGCIFIDLSTMSDEQIERLRLGFLVTSLLLMKHRFEQEYLLENLVEVVSFVSGNEDEPLENRIEQLKYVLQYLRSIINKWEEAQKKLRSVNLVNMVWDVDAEIKEEGFKEGLVEGMEKGMEKEAFTIVHSLIVHLPDASDEKIAQLTSKPVEFVARVRKEMTQTNGNAKHN